MKKLILIIVINIFLISNCFSQNWEECKNGLFGGDIICLVGSDNNLFAGTNGGGIIFSSNNGVSWTKKNNGLKDSIIYSIVIQGNNLFAGTDHGLYKSTNLGTNWTYVKSSISDFKVNSILLDDDKIIIGTENNGIFISTNSGFSWTIRNNGLASLYGISLYSNDSLIYCISNHKLYLTNNLGLNWMQIIINNDSNLFITDFTFFNNNLYLSTRKGIFSSIDNGSNWKSIYPRSFEKIKLLDSNLILSSGLELFYLNNLTYEISTIKYGYSSYTSVNTFIIRDNKIFVCTKNYGILVIDYKIDNWKNYNQEMTCNNIYSISSFNSNMLVTTGYGFFYSSNYGGNWENINQGNYYITSFFDDSIIYCAGSGIIKSINLGKNWVGITSNLDNCTIFSICKYEDKILVCTNQGLFYYNETSQGWIHFTDYFSLSQMEPSSIVVYDGNIYVSTLYSGIYVSNDKGENWTPILNGLEDLNIFSLTYGKGLLFAVTSAGVLYISSTNGKNWVKKNYYLNFKNLTTIALNRDTIYAGTRGNGLFKLSFNDFINLNEIDESVFAPTLFSLYPNPTNSNQLNIELNINSLNPICYQIISSTGFELSKCDLNQYSKQTIDIEGLPSGIYILLLNIDGTIESKKFVINK